MRKAAFAVFVLAFASSFVHPLTQSQIASLSNLPSDAIGIFFGFKIDADGNAVDLGGKNVREASVLTGKSETQLSQASRAVGGDGFTFPYGSYVRSSSRSIILAPGAKPSLNPEQIERILCYYKSPLCGFRDNPSGKSASQLIYEKSEEYRIDDWFALAVGRRESSWLRASGYMRHFAWGNILYNAPGRQFCSFKRSNGHCGYANFENSIEHFYYYIVTSRHYLPRGNDTPEEIMPIYAPPFENDTDGYIREINSCREAWVSGRVSC